MTKSNGRTARNGSPLRQRMIDQMRMANLADNTQESYVLEIRRLADHYGTSPDLLDAEQVRAWLKRQIERGLSPGSTNVALAALRFLYRDVLRRPDLVEGMRSRKVPRTLPRHLEVAEVERLLRATLDLRYRSAMLTAYAAGLRISEVVGLKVTDVRADRQLLHIRSGKGGTERMAPLPPGMVEHLRRYWKSICPQPTTWLFYGSSPQEPINVKALHLAFRKSRERAGLDKECTFHWLRHSMAAHVHERGGNIDVIQDALGHRNSDTTRAYARATGKMFGALDHPVSGFALLNA